MKWGIYDDYTIRKVKPTRNNSVLIRILEPRYKETGIPYKINYLDEYSAILELYFDDINFNIPDNYKDRFVQFNEDMVIELINFIKNNDFNEVNVHCNKGSSRSSAIMYCVALILNNKSVIKEIDRDSYYNPNIQVLDIFKKVFYIEY